MGFGDDCWTWGAPRLGVGGLEMVSGFEADLDKEEGLGVDV